jgi:hypothetical protein
MTINGGGGQTLLQLHPRKHKTEEMSHSVRHDAVSIVTPSRLYEGSPIFEEVRRPSSNSTQKEFNGEMSHSVRHDRIKQEQRRFLGLKP